MEPGQDGLHVWSQKAKTAAHVGKVGEMCGPAR